MNLGKALPMLLLALFAQTAAAFEPYIAGLGTYVYPDDKRGNADYGLGGQAILGLADVAVKHIKPRHQGEVPRALDNRETPAFEIDPARNDALDALAHPGRLETLAETGADPLACLAQLALAEAVDRSVTISERRPFAVGQLLFDQPLPPRRSSRSHPNRRRRRSIGQGCRSHRRRRC